MFLRTLLVLSLALAFAGCSSFTDSELAQIRSRGVHPEIMAKLRSGRPLDSEDVIELKRAGVRDELVVRQIDDAGVRYVITRQDVSRMRKARVSAWVIDRMLRASDRFAGQTAYDSDGWWYYDDPWWPQFYGSYQVGYGYGGIGFHRGFHERHHHGRHHRHR